MNTEISVAKNWPITLIILAQTKADGEKLLSKIDKSLFESIIISNMSKVGSEIDAVSRSQILLIDHPLKDDRVIKLGKALRQKYLPAQLSICCLVEKGEAAKITRLSQSGIFDFQISPLLKSVLNAKLVTCIINLQREYSLSQSLTQDMLTGLPNRQRFLDQCVSIYASAHRNQISMVTAMISPDHIGTINNNFGQSVGDMVIKRMADILARRKRDTDLLCRFDGNKFCLITVNMQDTHLITFLDDVLASFQAHEFEISGKSLDVTGSIGATKYLGQSITAMLDHANTALFQARDEGHNRFVIYEELETKPIPTWSTLN